MYSRSQKKSTFRLRTVFITVCVFITVARALCVLHFRCFFTPSPAAVVENTPLQVVTSAPCSRAGSVELRLEAGGRDVGLRSEACSPNSLWAAARPRSVGPWTGEASYSRVGD